MSNDGQRETRYRIAQRTAAAKERHNRIVERLTATPAQAFEEAQEEHRVKCRTGEFPNKWVDYDSDPETREPYEFDKPPSRLEAKRLCEGDPDDPDDPRCPIFQQCKNYADAKLPYHGIYGGRVREKGRWAHG